MKAIIRELAMAIILSWVLPWFLVSAVCSAMPADHPKPVTISQQDDKEILPQQEEQTIAPHSIIAVKKGDSVVQMPLDEYLTGVLLAEMPASFQLEAKKAQAVVARTYALRTAELGDKHHGSVCTDSTCCQGYLAPEDYLRSGGTQEYLDAARAAVQQTGGIVLTYDGELIEATYFSCSGGLTEDAVAVWGTDVPYLQSVESPGEENASQYTASVTIPASELLNTLGLHLSGNPADWFGTVTYTEGGGVASMHIGNKRFTGTQLRSALGLRSTAFKMQVSGTDIVITTKGYGHRVGMSQYGAQAMALDGCDYERILNHYYRGTTAVIWAVT